ncbi:hypothetical protein C1H46_039230 [Malus baccata]|uniref:Secretory carrier-associated membrane protein n=1 Tax=Malus baccata TaxID=106549 RepID=A0A540KM44_MALBA|nr:hypothetical protein C1H46_039230 [Malus baccata]
MSSPKDPSFPKLSIIAFSSDCKRSTLVHLSLLLTALFLAASSLFYGAAAQEDRHQHRRSSHIVSHGALSDEEALYIKNRQLFLSPHQQAGHRQARWGKPTAMATTINDLPEVILSVIITLVSANTDPLLAQRLHDAFPSVTSLTAYSRSPSTIQIVSRLWLGLRRFKLVRWHQRPHSPLGVDFDPLFRECQSLLELDLSEFYHWTEDLPPVLEAHPGVARSLTKLNLLTKSFTEGLKANEIKSITAACPKLQHLLVACMFDLRYIGFVGEEALLSISANCPELRVVHLVDTTSLANARDDPNDNGFIAEDTRVGRAALVDFFLGLPLLEELVLDVCNNVRDSGLALEVLGFKCPRLRLLKLGQFHGICSAIRSELDGIALCAVTVQYLCSRCALEARTSWRVKIWFLAVIYFISGAPGSYVLWYRPLYRVFSVVRFMSDCESAGAGIYEHLIIV